MPRPSQTPYRTITAAEFLDRLLTDPAPGAAQEYAYGGHENALLGVEGPVSLAGREIRLPVRVRHVIFLGPVDLSECRIAGSLKFEHCTFRQGLCLRDLRVDGMLTAAFCRLTDPKRKWIDCRRLRVQGLSDFTCSTAAVGIDFANSVFGDDLRLDGFWGRTALATEESIPTDLPVTEREHLIREMLGKGLNFEGSEFRKHLYAYPFAKRRFHVRGMIDLRGKVGGQVEFTNARVDAGQASVAVSMNSAEVAGSVFFRDDTRITGRIVLCGKVGGQVAFMNARVDAGQTGTAVNMSSAEVAGSVIFVDGTQVTGRIDLRGKVGGQVAFINARVDADQTGTAVDMESAEVTGPVFFRDGTRITGQIDLRGKVGGAGGVYERPRGCGSGECGGEHGFRRGGRLGLLQRWHADPG